MFAPRIKKILDNDLMGRFGHLLRRDLVVVVVKITNHLGELFIFVPKMIDLDNLLDNRVVITKINKCLTLE